MLWSKKAPRCAAKPPLKCAKWQSRISADAPYAIWKKGRIVIFACGTGNPYFSTDTAAALRAAEMGAEMILLAKNVDGIYDSDPKLNPDAKKYNDITYKQVLADDLTVMDSPAIALCMENNIPILVFAMNEKNSIVRAVSGEQVGTLVHK